MFILKKINDFISTSNKRIKPKSLFLCIFDTCDATWSIGIDNESNSSTEKQIKLKNEIQY